MGISMQWPKIILCQLSRVCQKYEKNLNFCFALIDVKIKTKMTYKNFLFEAIFTDFWPFY